MTSSQLDLFVAEVVTPEYAPDLSIQERYELWRDANPWIVPALAALLDDWSAHGGKRVGVKCAAEWLRWHHARAVETTDFKVNNSHTSRLARDLIDRYPHLAGVIETRQLRAA